MKWVNLWWYPKSHERFFVRKSWKVVDFVNPFDPDIPFLHPLKLQKTFTFVMFSWNIEMEHWAKMDPTNLAINQMMSNKIFSKTFLRSYPEMFKKYWIRKLHMPLSFSCSLKLFLKTGLCDKCTPGTFHK